VSALGALLAGGRSRRMGTDKALLPVADGTLLDYMAAKLGTLPLDEIVICRDAPGCLADAVPGLGPIGALSALSTAYPGREVLVVPIDMPLLSTATLMALLGGGNHQPRHYAGHFLPLRLVLDPAAIAAIAHRASPQAGDRSLAGLLRALDARTLPPPGDAEELANLNRPEDWDRVRRLLDGSAGRSA